MTTVLTERSSRGGDKVLRHSAGAWSDRLCFALVFSVVNLHLLRNVSTLGYLALYGIVSLWVFWCFLRTDKRTALDDRGAVIFVWISIGFLGLLSSVAVISPFGAAYGTVRYLFAVPVFFALVAFTKSLSDLRSHIATMILFFIVASWTLPLQFITGPIPWFDEASVRGGEVRYSSLIGSLTSIGVVVGCYLALCAIMRHPWVWVLLALASLPAAVSLSKAALANVVLGWLVCAWFNRHRLGVLLGATVGLPVLAVLASALVPAIRLRVETVAVSFGLQSGAGSLSNDVSLMQSIRDRLTGLPGENWSALGDFDNPLVYLTGGGYGMGNTALVTEGDVTAPMAHNQFVETLSVFGLVGGLVQIAILLTIMVLLVITWWRIRKPVFAALAAMYALYLLNGLLANGVVYQPAGASLLFLAMFTALSPVVRLDAAEEAADLSASSRKEKKVNITELMLAFRRHWVAALVGGAVGIVATLGATVLIGGDSDPGATPVNSYVRVAFTPDAESSSEAATLADFIQTQIGYWSQLAQTDETLAEANEGDGSETAIEQIRSDCLLALPADNVLELKCLGTDPEVTQAFLTRWAAAVEKVVMDRGLPSGLQSSVNVASITEPVEESEAAVGAVDASGLKYPFALMVGLVSALAAVLGRHLRARRRAA